MDIVHKAEQTFNLLKTNFIVIFVKIQITNFNIFVHEATILYQHTILTWKVNVKVKNVFNSKKKVSSMIVCFIVTLRNPYPFACLLEQKFIIRSVYIFNRKVEAIFSVWIFSLFFDAHTYIVYMWILYTRSGILYLQVSIIPYK